MQPIILLSRFAKKKTRCCILKRETYTCKVAISLNSRKRRRTSRNRESQSEREGCKKNLFWATRRGREELRVWRGAERGGKKKESLSPFLAVLFAFFAAIPPRMCNTHTHTQTTHTSSHARTHECSRPCHTTFTRVEIGSPFPEAIRKSRTFQFIIVSLISVRFGHKSWTTAHKNGKRETRMGKWKRNTHGMALHVNTPAIHLKD